MTPLWTVLVTDRFASESEIWLRTQSQIDLRRTNQPQPTAPELNGVHGLIIRSRTLINDELLKVAPQLKVICTATSGFDHIDLKATQARGITVMYTPEANVQSAAELTWALVLASVRKSIAAHRAVKSGEWRREFLTGEELYGQHYGIIGLGRIGSRVAQIARAFGMTVSAYDPYVESNVFTNLQVQRASLEELLKQCDIVSFHVPKTHETHHLLNRSRLEYVRRGVILINTSRGSVIDEADLDEALRLGWVKAAGLDVFEREPLPRNSSLLHHENVTLSPHIGATTSQAFAKASQMAAESVVDYLLWGKTRDLLPPSAPWFRID